MLRKLLLPLLIACGLVAVSSPAALAQSSLASKVGNLSGKVAGIEKSIAGLKDTNAGQNDAIDRVNARVSTVVSNLAPVLSALPTVTTALGALADPVTGLRALNLARPKFINFTTQPTSGAGATNQSGATVNGGTTPGATVQYAGADGGAFFYLIDMKTKITDRAPLVSVNTPGGGGIGFSAPSITPCGVNSDSINFCNGKFPGSASETTAIMTTPDAPDNNKTTYTAVFIAG